MNKSNFMAPDIKLETHGIVCACLVRSHAYQAGATPATRAGGVCGHFIHPERLTELGGLGSATSRVRKQRSHECRRRIVPI